MQGIQKSKGSRMKLTIEKCPGRRYNPSRSKLLSAVLFSSASALVLTLASGCALTRQETITGEPVLHSIDPTSGSLYDRDILPNGEDAQGIIPHEGEIITVVVHDIFLKYLKESSTPHVLVYAEVYDDGTDNPETAVSKVLWNELNQPSGVRLGLADRVLYGPTPYKGFPLRIRLYIVELDKEEKKAASAL